MTPRPSVLLLLTACTAPPPLEAPVVQLDGPAAHLRLVALGDTGEGNASQRLVAEQVARVCAEKADASGPGCDMLVLLGDLVYPGGIDGPEDPLLQERVLGPYAALGLPIYAIVGNHDYGERPFDRDRAEQVVAAARAHEGLEMPGRAYAVHHPVAQLLALDTHEVLMEPLWGVSRQRSWVDRELARVHRPWTVVLAHHPYRSNGQHGNAGTYEGKSWLPVASGAAVEGFVEDHLCGKVDLLLSGHEHNLQWLEPQCGMELVVSGAGAKVTPLVDRGAPTLFQSDASEGFVWIELTAETLRGEVWSREGQRLFERSKARAP